MTPAPPSRDQEPMHTDLKILFRCHNCLQSVIPLTTVIVKSAATLHMCIEKLSIFCYAILLSSPWQPGWLSWGLALRYENFPFHFSCCYWHLIFLHWVSTVWPVSHFMWCKTKQGYCTNAAVISIKWAFKYCPYIGFTYYCEQLKKERSMYIVSTPN